eukprot:5334670-Amphidinium_carterae.1
MGLSFNLWSMKIRERQHSQGGHQESCQDKMGHQQKTGTARNNKGQMQIVCKGVQSTHQGP